MSSQAPMDFLRLQKALAFEAEAGFNDLQGNQYRFSEFLQIALGEPSPVLDRSDRQKLQTLAEKYSSYGDLEFADRQHLVAETRRTVYSLKQSTQQSIQQQSIQQQPAKDSATKTIIRSTTNSSKEASPSGKIPDLEQAVTYLPGVGPKSAEKLAKLGIITVRDLLYYYPREHIDYARQAKIRDLIAGETATIVGTITSCNCFTTVKNNKLTIFDLTIKDSSGRMKLSRFFMGSRFSGRGWQEQQKKMHPTGAAVAASGLVKETNYGLTLDNPQIEILEFDGEVDSDVVGRILPIYPLTDGVGADLVRRAMKSGLPAAARLAETLPEGLRSQYNLAEIQRAIAQIHFPDDRESLDAARKRLVFDEFFYLQLGLLSRRYREQAKQTSVILQPEGSLITEFYDGLPFELTKAQARVVNEIQNDLTKPVPMNRLIQG
ncbi:MAG: DNA helicase RecG, partial [Alkalinema sp. CAN_BIN05]|nr:DNA helicase RecG [Alkalinema sp. CAN_BIN05]